MCKAGVIMKLSDCLNKNTRTKLKNLSKQPKPEILTDKDLLELMGVNRQTYVRNRGAVKRK